MDIQVSTEVKKERYSCLKFESMADDKSKKDYRDRIKINTHESYEVSYWTKKWLISPQQLRGAVRATGSSSVKEIEQYLRKNNKI